MLDKLYHEGVDFLYGMLFEKSFFARALVRAPSDQQPKADPLAFTVAVHGDNTECLERIVSNQSAPCHIFFVENKGSTLAVPSQCSTFHLNAAEAESDDPSLQFLQGMMYVTERARSGFVSGPYSSQSSDLIRQRIEFLRRQEVWKLGRIPPILPHFWTCEDNEKHHHV